MSTNDIKEREKAEALDEIKATIPPEDIVAFNESRSCADLFRLYQKGQLDIQPKFQRGIVWSDKEQALFVDSLIKQLPIPSLCISVDVKTQKRLVIDGLQRMWTIIHFLNFENDDWKIPKTSEIDPDISNQKVSDIQKHSPVLFDKLENLTIPITVLRCNYDKSDHMAYLFQIFRRLNSGGSKLLNQEIRNCIYTGNFNDFLREFAQCNQWLDFAKTTKKAVEKARFGNEERILRFFAMLSNWKNYSGNLARFLNNYMENKRNLSSKEIDDFRSVLTRTINIAMKLNIPTHIHKNKNLVEAILVGIASNISTLEKLQESEIDSRFQQLQQTRPFSEDIREGMAHTIKVKERISESIRIWSI